MKTLKKSVKVCLNYYTKMDPLLMGIGQSCVERAVTYHNDKVLSLHFTGRSSARRQMMEMSQKETVTVILLILLTFLWAD